MGLKKDVGKLIPSYNDWRCIREERFVIVNLTELANGRDMPTKDEERRSA